MRPKPKFDEPAVTVGSRPLRYVFTTSVGQLNLVVDPALSRRAANSFIFLVGKGFYDGLPFHRVVPGFIAQTGCPRGAGDGDAGYLLDGETPRDHVYRRGDVALASSGSVGGRGAHGSQFFVCLADLPGLDPVYPPLGHVVGSDGTLDRLNGLAVSAQGHAATGVKVVSARLVAG
jgi:cyclophilin family peptidyl-prolyl cis-trans isomerase